MAEDTYLCHQCGNIFKVPLENTRNSGDETTCPKCGSSGVRNLPSWEPLGSGLSELPPEWEYECQSCQHRFRLPVPDSPSQEKSIKCPECDGGHIHRLTRTGSEPLYCG